MGTSICIIIGGKRSKQVKQQIAKIAADQYLIFEGDGRACENLQKHFDNKVIHIEQCFISSSGEPETYYQLNDPQFNALAKPTGLFDLFPNLKLTNVDKVETIQLCEVIKQHCQVGSGHILVLNESAQTKLESLLSESWHTRFSEIHIATQSAELYAAYSTPSQVTRLLQDKYFKCAPDLLRENDPDFPFLSFTADYLMRLVDEQGCALNEQMKQLQRLSEQQTEKINEHYCSLELSITDLMKEARKEIHTLKIEIENIKSQGSAEPDLKQHIEKGFSKLGQVTQKQITNATTQLESFISLQSYLKDGQRPLSFHGWPISPDIGLQIASLIDRGDYDLVIEFGSGTSTVLMAKALSNKYSLKGEGEVPKVVTFEHHPKYYKQTQEAIEASKLDSIVDLIYAPLVDFKYSDENDYLYYDCSTVLERYARTLKGKPSNILVLVDGPPGSTNKHARFPAIIFLLNHLSEHSFTVIMDDYCRVEEKEVVEKWIEILNRRGRPTNFEKVINEKGAGILSF